MIWYPYEQMKTMREPYKILDAEGEIGRASCRERV